MTKPANVVAIFGAGQIGMAFYELLLRSNWLDGAVSARLVDFNPSALNGKAGELLDIARVSTVELVKFLTRGKITHVVNCLPFTFNVKLATAAQQAGCHYIDFTEDDAAARAVAELYASAPTLFCAPKCGLAPGFVNYVGADLVNQLRATDPEIKVHHLKIRVGALPRNVAFDVLSDDATGAPPLAGAYALTWSIDGLINEYIRPCQVRRGGHVQEVDALTGPELIIINGVEYEARFTSGGVGTLINDFPDIDNVDYKTIRYRGHYDYVIGQINEAGRNFDALKARFKRDLAWTNQDIVIVFAQALSLNSAGQRHVRTYAERFVGTAPLTAIQTTTAGAGLAILELMLVGKLGTGGLIGHANVRLDSFTSTRAYQLTYCAAGHSS